MDIVVNAPVKAGVRRDRTKGLFNYFQAWKIERLKAALDPLKTIPAFAPPKPKVSDGIQTLLRVCNSTFVDKSFINSLEKSFVDCCLAPIDVTDTDKEYKVYRSHKHGSMAKSFFSPSFIPPEQGSLGDLVADVDVFTRNDGDMGESDVEESDEESDEESEESD